MGGSTTSISVFSKGIYINNLNSDIGGETLDKELALFYNITKKDAIYLKETLASGDINNNSKETFILVNKDGKELKITSEEVSKIVNKKLIEMLKSIKNNINYLTKKEISYIIITGGLAELKDLALPVNRTFSNAKIGFINDIGARDASSSVSLGMLKYFNEKLNLRGKEYSMLNDEELDYMVNSSNSKLITNGDNILSKVFNYFFDN